MHLAMLDPQIPTLFALPFYLQDASTLQILKRTYHGISPILVSSSAVVWGKEIRDLSQIGTVAFWAEGPVYKVDSWAGDFGPDHPSRRYGVTSVAPFSGVRSSTSALSTCVAGRMRQSPQIG